MSKLGRRIGGEPSVKNWAGNVIFNAANVYRPTSIEELQETVAGTAQARALGTGHSFSRIADTKGDLIAVDRLPSVINVDAENMTVSVSGGTRYAELATALQRHGLALANLGSLPHISVAGACATGTHGSGDRNRILASAVTSLTLVTADGSLTTLSRGDAEFDGAVVSLGALGIVTSLRLEVHPTFDVEQYVYDGLTWNALLANFDAVMASGYSVSVFTDWFRPGRIWVKRRGGEAVDDLTDIGVRRSGRPLHPVAGLPAENCTQQLGVPGSWHERLPHFRADFRPATGDELQSEYLVSREHAVDALDALHGIRAWMASVLQTSEIRTVAADDCWLSPSYRQDNVAIHFTWHPDMNEVGPVLEVIEKALEPFDARPHWGKLFTTRADRLATSYPKWPDFNRLMGTLDPAGKFRNDFITRLFPI